MKTSKKTFVTILAVTICAGMLSGCAFFTKILNLDGQNPGQPYDSSTFDIFVYGRDAETNTVTPVQAPVTEKKAE